MSELHSEGFWSTLGFRKMISGEGGVHCGDICARAGTSSILDA
jgi:hypothetical protein